MQKEWSCYSHTEPSTRRTPIAASERSTYGSPREASRAPQCQHGDHWSLSFFSRPPTTSIMAATCAWRSQATKICALSPSLLLPVIHDDGAVGTFIWRFALSPNRLFFYRGVQQPESWTDGISRLSEHSKCVFQGLAERFLTSSSFSCIAFIKDNVSLTHMSMWLPWITM